MTPRPSLAAVAVAVAVLVLAVTAQAPAARAQEVARPQLTEAQKQRTKEHYEKATLLYNVAKYPEAIVEYEAAYLISADPAMLYNIAQCHRKNNQPEEAARFYRNYLRNAPGADRPNAPRREDVEKWIAEMDRAAEEKRRQPTTPPAAIPGAAPVTPPSGAAAGAGTTEPAPVPGTGLPPGSAPEAGTSAGFPAGPAPERPSRAWPLTFMIGGGVLVGTSLVFAAVAGQKAKELEDRSKEPGARFDDAAKDIEEQGKAASGLAVLTGLVGLAAVGTGAYLWIRTPSSVERAAARPAVYPLAGRGLVGGGAHFTF
jgi:tetratricopeptide (TPR) repeat protein